MVKKSIYFLFFLLVGIIAFSFQEQDSYISRQPNVIIILTDDQGYADVGFNGSKDIKTPNLDRIANNGVKFTNGYVSYAVCGPSRAGLITGRYQDRFGFSRNPLFTPKDSSEGLPISEETLAEALDKKGYENMAIGKWHLGAHKSQRPLKRGFDHFFGFLSGGHSYFPKDLVRYDISEVNGQFDAYRTKLLKNNERIDEKEYLTDAFSREAVDFVEKNKDKPFFLYLAYNAPHTPLQATKKYLDRYPGIENKKRKTYAAMVSAVDDGVGHLLDKLEELKIEDNTIVFFLSDNGGPKKSGSSNGILRDGKGSLHEGGIRVPFAVQWPSVIPKGKEYNHPIISLDIFATVVAQVGVNSKNTLDGVDLIPYLTGKQTKVPHEELYWRKFDQGGFAIRKGDFKLLKMSGDIELYNINLDVREEHNIENQKQVFDSLKKSYERWNALNIDPVFLGLVKNKQYNQKHPNRFKNVEKY
jgi:arylsulfatase A-like enzyme